MVTVILKGRMKAAESAHQGRAWLAWHVAALERQKKLPPLAKLMGKGGSQQHRPAEMLAYLKALKANGVAMNIRKKTLN